MFIVHSYSHFLCWVFFFCFFFFPHSHMILSNRNNLQTVIWFEVFLSNSNNYMLSSNYFHLVVICLHTVIWFQVTIILSKQLWLQVTILNTNNLQLYNIKYSYLILIIFRQIYLIRWCDPNILPLWLNIDLGGYGNERVLRTPQSSKTGSSSSDAV